jgi:hypothetical protein
MNSGQKIHVTGKPTSHMRIALAALAKLETVAISGSDVHDFESMVPIQYTRKRTDDVQVLNHFILVMGTIILR